MALHEKHLGAQRVTSLAVTQFLLIQAGLNRERRDARDLLEENQDTL